MCDVKVCEPMKLPSLRAHLFLLAIALTHSLAYAAPEEIQVYLDEFADVGGWGLDIHTNYVAALQVNPSSTVTRKMLRMTPEVSYGINQNWEVAGYLLTSKGPDQAQNQPQIDGVKARVKWRPDSSVNAEKNGSPWYWAVNFEMGQLNQRFNPEQKVGQLKLIGLWRQGNWTVGGNVNFDRTLNASSAIGATTEVDTKLAYRIGNPEGRNFQIGLEQYAYRGAMSGAFAGQNKNKMNFLAVDFEVNKWELNIGLGRATGAVDDKTLIKAVIGVPF
jgi:hypothetical protein